MATTVSTSGASADTAIGLLWRYRYWLLLVVVLTTPLQSAAEEYLFRGYLSQAVAAWVRHPAAGPRPPKN